MEIDVSRIFELQLLINNEIGEFNHHLCKGLLQVDTTPEMLKQLNQARKELFDLLKDGLIDEAIRELEAVHLKLESTYHESIHE